MLVTWCKVIQNMHTIKSTYIVFKVLFLYIVRLMRVETCHEVANNRGPALLCDVWSFKVWIYYHQFHSKERKWSL